MKLLVDLGNTRLKCALADGDTLQAVHAFAHGGAAAGAGAEFTAQLSDWLLQVDAPQGVWLASVAGEGLTRQVQGVFEVAGHRVQRVLTQASTPTLRVAYADPQRLGVDRWLAMLAARARATTPVLIASVGSALTVDAVDGHGQHLGGLIAPTPEAMREALFARAPHLRGGSGLVSAFATNTEDAVASGSLLSGVALIERSLAALAGTLSLHLESAVNVPSDQALGAQDAPADARRIEARLLLSGGGIEPLRPWLPPHTHVPNLVLEGLAQWTASTH